MSLAINHNLMASNIARSLNQHYSRLYQSTQRLSSGLRINGAADDAAGLAIRELQRADIAALHQGARNVNDAISMIQTFDGALSVIDEKLIRMKELAEQAATGTYNSTQRLMIDSEFIAMASEINRIAVATDFNGVKLLCDDASNKIISKAYFKNSLYTKVPAPVLGFFTDPVVGETTILNDNAIKLPIKDFTISQTKNLNIISIEGDIKAREWQFDFDENFPPPEGNYVFKYDKNSDTWSLLESPSGVFEYYEATGSNFDGQFFEVDEFGVPMDNYIGFRGNNVTYMGDNGIKYSGSADLALTADTTFTLKVDKEQLVKDGYRISNNNGYTNAKILAVTHGRSGEKDPIAGTELDSFVAFEIDLDGDNKADILQKFTSIGYYPDPRDPTDPNRAPVWANGPEMNRFSINIDFTTKIHFGTGNDSAEDYYYIDTRDCTLKGLGIDDLRIETQEKAQKALVRINDAIEKKDNARAYFGAIQNRLENTVTNLQTQAENLQAAESRISDTDVAIEMTNFIRNQILTQSATAMLSQANSLPQMAMQIIGG